MPHSSALHANANAWSAKQDHALGSTWPALMPSPSCSMCMPGGTMHHIKARVDVSPQPHSK
eukprot:1115653-Karenia_brevis.AAC.1